MEKWTALRRGLSTHQILIAGKHCRGMHAAWGHGGHCSAKHAL